MDKHNDSEQELLKAQKIIGAQTEEICALKSENEQLRVKLAQALHQLYGKKSEKAPEEDTPVFDEPVVIEAELATIKEAEETISIASHTRTKPKRKPLPAEFKRETVIHDVPLEKQLCSCCGERLHCIGEDISEKLDYVPAQIKVIQHIRKKYGCRGCEIGVTQADLPPDFLPKALAAPGLLTHVILSKYQDHQPLYRQEGIWQRLGVDIPRSTLCNWVLLAAERLEILKPLLKEAILKTQYARADETPVQVMEENKVRLSKRAYMWVFTTGRKEKPVIYFEFAFSRRGEIATEFFSGFKGHLQTDGFSGYNELRKTEGITSVGCMAHCRRKFFAITKTATTPGSAHYAVTLIAKLYKIEAEIKKQTLTEEQIREYRQTHSAPILNTFEVWLKEREKQVPPKGPLGKAIQYALNHWAALTVYLCHGFLDMDNNFAEQRIRPFALGRKNWMFVGNERGGQAAAMLYTLIETAKANHLNTHAYFNYLLTELPKVDPGDQTALKGLLPMNLTPQMLDSS